MTPGIAAEIAIPRTRIHPAAECYPQGQTGLAVVSAFDPPIGMAHVFRALWWPFIYAGQRGERVRLGRLARRIRAHQPV